MKFRNIIHTAVFILIGFPMMAQTTNFWTKKNDFTGLKRERAVAFTIDSVAYVGTGVDTAEIVHNDFWSYNATTDSWSQVADLPASVRRNAIAFSINGTGYVGTGIDSVSAQAPSAAKLNDFWAYTPSTNSWEQKADFTGAFGAGIYFSTAFAVGGKGYVCCGKMGPNNYSNMLWEYNPSNDQWLQRANFPPGVRYQLSSFVIDDKAYVGLGTDQDLYRKDFWCYNPGLNSWTQIADLPASQRSGSMTFTIGQRGYVCMGANGGMLDDLWEYNPFTDLWSSKAPYGGSARKNGVAFVINGKAYVGTGKGFSGKKASMHEYTPGEVLSVDEYGLDISFYPNPAHDFLHVNTLNEKVSTISLLNLNGQAVIPQTSSNEMDVRSISKGVYLLAAHNKSQQIISTQKVIIR